MNKNEIFVKWIEALRSGKYERGKDLLKSYEDGKMKYCCLGVLCEVMGIQNKRNKYSCEYEYKDNNDYWERHVLPTKIAASLNISACGAFKIPVEYDGRLFISLSTINDATDITFVEMADIIEENLQSDNFLYYYSGE